MRSRGPESEALASTACRPVDKALRGDCRLSIVHWDAACRFPVFCQGTGVVAKQAENDAKGAARALEERHGIAEISYLSLSGK